MKNKLFLWSLTVALAGFLFGFDTAVISGADQLSRNYGTQVPLFILGLLCLWLCGEQYLGLC